MHIGGGFDGELVGEDVAHFVGDDAGNLIFGAGAGDELAREIDAAAGEREAVDLGGFDQGVVKLDSGGGQGGKEAVADGLDVGAEGGVADGTVVTVDVIGHGLAEPLLLLLGEDVGLGGLEDGWRGSAGGCRLLSESGEVECGGSEEDGNGRSKRHGCMALDRK